MGQFTVKRLGYCTLVQCVIAASAAMSLSATGADHYVRVVVVEAAPAALPLRFTGVARAQQRATLAFQVSGQLAERPVFVGSRVMKGDELARLSNPQLGPAVSNADARLRQIEARQAQNFRDLSRVNKLFKLGAATREEREQLQSQRSTLAAGKRAAQASQQMASQMQQETVLVAPFRGQVVRVDAEPGEFLQPGKPVLELLADSALEVELAVPERLARQLISGQQVALRVGGGVALQEQGIVSRIASATSAGQLYPVLVSLPGPPNVRAGQLVEVLLPHATSAKLAVPVRCIVDTGSGQPRVYRLRQNDGDLTAEAVVVTPQGIASNKVLIGGELQVGDRIVLDGLNGLIDGLSVVLAP